VPTEHDLHDIAWNELQLIELQRDWALLAALEGEDRVPLRYTLLDANARPIREDAASAVKRRNLLRSRPACDRERPLWRLQN
jgi:hypothetical protein